jgi:hypothetical protein
VTRLREPSHGSSVHHSSTLPVREKFPSQLVRDDGFFMSLAYNQAIDAWRQDEVPIGA